ncbi:MAG: hypothetical protein LIO65_08035 [Odoribacter sp.]|nr:hypothetical protein [Odoribacter sp.]
MFKIYIFNFPEKDYLQIAEQLSNIGCCAYYATEKSIREITKSPSVIIANCDAVYRDSSMKEVIADLLKKPSPPIIVLISYYYNQCRENFSEYVYNRNVYFLRRPFLNEDFTVILKDLNFKPSSKEIIVNELLKASDIPVHSTQFHYLRKIILAILDC